MERRKVILITDGDEHAKKVVEFVAEEIGGRCISYSYGNPTPISGEEIVSLVLQTPYDPVLVMFDDCGQREEGIGERAMHYVATHPQIEVLGAIAVASSTHSSEWTHVDVSVDRYGHLTEYGVDKEGIPDLEIGRINGDTVYILDELDIPIVVGVGDIGKMAGFDTVKKGAPITKQAVEIILERSGYHESST
ncbi:stage V sporulation protein AE [Alkalihalobacillus sp. MEB130]|uniref:stage V sporulation protein AE n=1 Tax=Alkalihalobacillus sp. MEB130 TaxID=2976704 RepID=UPI0028DF3820|nr:stage V sporulation protein AE [Alkalihalobacillus sp. MEB130]MDT8859805.1 stage V sporulation protein AE [Alkalihalobacillus sp. MEB130]